MSPLVKMKRQANFKDFKRFGAFKGLVEQKNVVFNSFVCQLGFFFSKNPNLHKNSSNKLLLYFFLTLVSYTVSMVYLSSLGISLKYAFLYKIHCQ
jgi:hypothetical protein